MRPTKSRSWFTRLTKGTAHISGRPTTFAVAASIILVWALTGPIFRFSDTWQLVINTGTTIVTFLMVFLIQSTQNRDTEAIQVKLDEIIRAIGDAQMSCSTSKSWRRRISIESVTRTVSWRERRVPTRAATVTPAITLANDSVNVTIASAFEQFATNDTGRAEGPDY